MPPAEGSFNGRCTNRGLLRAAIRTPMREARITVLYVWPIGIPHREARRALIALSLGLFGRAASLIILVQAFALTHPKLSRERRP